MLFIKSLCCVRLNIYKVSFVHHSPLHFFQGSILNTFFYAATQVLAEEIVNVFGNM